MNNFNNKNLTQEEKEKILLNRQKYSKLLNNLLNISNKDPVIFTKIDNNNHFDIYEKFGKEFQDEILKSPSFSISVKDVDIPIIISSLKMANSIEEIKAIYNRFHIRLSQLVINALEKNFSLAKKSMLDNWESKEQKWISKWKIFLNRAIEINSETNIWPLNIAYYYISIKTSKRVYYAPIFLKECYLEIKSGSLFLSSNNDVVINQKLLYLLQNEGFLTNFNSENSFLNISPEEFINSLLTAWNINEEFPNIQGPFQNKKNDEITNKSIKFHSGMVLGFFDSSGGSLRKNLQDIVDSDEIDDIIKVNFDKNSYRKKVLSVIFKDDFYFYKIQKTNFSQDLATISSLIQNTIIWGPPGTGKSQTISNIIANILIYNKTALVVSQKKAALEVLKNRLEDLSVFCIFVLNGRLMNKKDFYDPLQKYLDNLEHFENPDLDDAIKIIYPEEKKYIDILDEILKLKNFEEILKILNYIYDNSNVYSEKILNAFFKLNYSFTYANLLIGDNKKRAIKNFFLINNIKKNNIKLSHKNAEKYYEILKNDLKDFYGDIDFVLGKLKYFEKNHLLGIEKFSKYKFNSKFKEVNDLKLIQAGISKNIITKIKNFDNEYKKLYSEFAMSVRKGFLSPQKFINLHYKIIKILFPIIITTPETELNYWKKEEFDYAILDESSQIFLEKGLPVLYKAKIKILAGDDQQMQPTRWFASRDENQEENYLSGIESLLDYAITKGTYSVLLDKNYRSNYASLMTFSSKHFYNSELDVLDVNSNSSYLPIEVININGKWENSTNKAEAEQVLKIATAELNNYQKIIILCFNSSQQNLLEQEIFESIPILEEAINKEHLLLRNIENIQGDEADLVIASVSYDSTTKLHSTYVAKSGGKNALNVAISRAKDKMIIVKSIYAKDISTINTSEDLYIFREWLNFLDLDTSLQKKYINSNSIEKTLTENLFIKNNENLINDIYQNLNLKLNLDLYELKTNYAIGTKSIDIAILDKNTKKVMIAIFADNYYYHESYYNYINDKDQVNFIKSKNYKIKIVRQIEWSLYKSKIITQIIEEIKSI